MPIPAAYPYIDVTIDESALIPVATRSAGVIAVVGGAMAGNSEITTTAENTPVVIDTADDTAQFAKVTSGSVSTSTALRDSLLIALEQNPRPHKIYGVRAKVTNNTPDYAAALQSLEAADDVDFVALANETDVTALGLLKVHVETASSSGNKQIAVAMVNPTTAKSPTYVHDTDAAVEGLKSSSGRMVMMAARGATVDVACAAMGAIAGFDPQVSLVLKELGQVTIPLASQYSPSEITGLSEAGINPVVSPALIVGGGFFFGDGRLYSSDPALQFIDVVRVLDDLDFRLKAGLIGAVGDDRITKSGLTLLLSRTEGILQPLRDAAEIDDFTIDIPLLDILGRDPSTWTPGDHNLIDGARANRQVVLNVKVVLGPDVHQIQVKAAPSFS